MTIDVAYVPIIAAFCVGVLVGMLVVFVWVAVNRRDT